MEKQAAPKSYSSSKKAMSKFLPRVEIASVVTFDHHHHHHHHHHDNTNKLRVVYPAAAAGRRGFSGPILSMIPPEARRETKNGTRFESPEPTSPKVSCMGQLVKPKKKKKGGSKVPDKIPTRLSTASSLKKKNKEGAGAGAAFSKRSSSMKLPMMIRRMLPAGRKSSAGSAADEIETTPSRSSGAPPPPLCHMKRFSSGRDAFASFDWASADEICRRRNPRNQYSDDEDALERSSDDDEGEGERYDVDDDDREDFRIPFSAPISGGGGGGSGGMAPERRKEINLWKRRTMAPPRPLELKI